MTDQTWILIGWPVIHIVVGLLVLCLCRRDDMAQAKNAPVDRGPGYRKPCDTARAPHSYKA
jgi:cytochrome c-type biogenesis protein CcmH/NrfF